MKKEAKYVEIENHIKSKITSGEFPIGGQIPTEKQLALQFHTSRMTANKAIVQLVNDKYIERIAGKGSFVINLHVTKHISTPNSFTKDMESIGLVAGSKLLDFRLIRAREVPEVAKALELENDDSIYYFVRLRTGNDTPIAISYTYVNAKIVPALDIKALKRIILPVPERLGNPYERHGMRDVRGAAYRRAEKSFENQ